MSLVIHLLHRWWESDAYDRDNYHINIVARAKAEAIEGLFPEADSESEEDYPSSAED